MQPCLQFGHEQYCQHDGDYVTLITQLVDLAQCVGVRDLDVAEQVPYTIAVRGCPAVGQVGVDHHQTYDSAEEDVAAENSCRGDRDDNGQISKRGVRDHIQEREPVSITKAKAGDLRQSFDQTHHKTGCYDRGQDRYEYIADGLKETDVQRLLGGSCCLDLFLGSCGCAGDGKELVIDLVNGTGTDDQLQLAIGLEHTLNAVYVLECFLVDFSVISDNKTKSGSAVSSRYDIRAAADIIGNFLGAFSVI